MTIRSYNPQTDYEAVKTLYLAPSTFGGQYDDARDTAERLAALVKKKPESILVAEGEGKIVGTVTLFEDGRSAWLYRFAVQSDNETEITQTLYEKAREVLKSWGHQQVLVYAPAGDAHFEDRYVGVGMNKGSDFTAYWQDI